MPEANNQQICRWVSPKLRVLGHRIRQMPTIQIAQPNWQRWSDPGQPLQQAQRILLEHGIEKNLSIVQDRQVAWKCSNRFLHQSGQLKDPLGSSQVQKPSRDLRADVEHGNLFGISQGTKNRRPAAAGRPTRSTSRL